VRNGRPLMLGVLAIRLFAEEHSAPVVGVIASAGVEAHRAAIEGIRAALGPAAEVRVADAGQGSAKAPLGPDVRVVIAVGSEAVRLLESERSDVAAVYAMVLRSRAEWEVRGRRAPVVIPLEIPLASLLTRLKPMFPGKTRLGIILGPSGDGMTAAQRQSRALQEGFTVRVAECQGAEELPAALASFKNQIDFVWCLPDGTLYNSVTVKSLILESIDKRLPLIGFSESFAKAGAAVSVYPDFRDIGMQAGEAAKRLLEGQNIRSAEGPRRLKVAVNQSVLRLLGLRYAPSGAEREEVSILQ